MPCINSLLVLVVATGATQIVNAQSTLLLQEEFNKVAGPFSPGSSTVYDPAIMTGVGQWMVANNRPDFNSIP